MNPCARALKSIRLANNLTQNELSEQLGITPSFVGQLEQGKAYPSFEVLNRIVTTFNVDANIFFGGGSTSVVVDDSFYALVSGLSSEQLEGIKNLLRFIANVSTLKNDVSIEHDDAK